MKKRLEACKKQIGFVEVAQFEYATYEHQQLGKIFAAIPQVDKKNTHLKLYELLLLP